MGSKDTHYALTAPNGTGEHQQQRCLPQRFGPIARIQPLAA